VIIAGSAHRSRVQRILRYSRRHNTSYPQVEQCASTSSVARRVCGSRSRRRSNTTFLPLNSDGTRVWLTAACCAPAATVAAAAGLEDDDDGDDAGESCRTYFKYSLMPPSNKFTLENPADHHGRMSSCIPMMDWQQQSQILMTHTRVCTVRAQIGAHFDAADTAGAVQQDWRVLGGWRGLRLRSGA